MIAANGDIYSRQYEGLYCIRCERFYKPEELIDERCPIHGTVPERVDEENYFFRLSAYEDRLRDLITSNEMVVQPEHRREEMLSFINQGLEDSALRSRSRSGWACRCPATPTSDVRLGRRASNDITALDYADDASSSSILADNRTASTSSLGHHSLPSLLAGDAGAAGLPTRGRSNVPSSSRNDGEKMSKPRQRRRPDRVVDQYGVDAVRYGCCAHPRTSDATFVPAAGGRYNTDLATISAT